MSPSRAPSSGTVVAGIPISHPDRIIFPELGVTKLQLARYYEAIGDWIVPHVRSRPLTLVHCPQGLGGPCRYLRHTKVWGPNVLRRVRIQEKTKIGEYLVADDLPGVIAVMQMGVVEIHTWNSTTDHLEQPNRIVWDLDPGPRVTWRQVVAAARLLREVLRTLGLESWVKTTGGRGLHVVVPLAPRRDWSECLAFSRDVASALTRSDPTLFTTTFSKRGREAQILIDYLRNNRTNTSVSAYSTRARPGAPVSVPVDWGELLRRSEPWSLPTLTTRLRRRRADPWSAYWTTAQSISDAAVEAVRRV